MTYLPPDPPADVLGAATFSGAPKATPESVLAAPRSPVTRWNRRYLAAGAAVLAGLVAVGFWIGFGSARKPPAKPAPRPTADTTVMTPAIADRFAKGYEDPALHPLGAPGQTSLPLPTPAALPAGHASPPPPPVDPTVVRAAQEAREAQSSGPFFSGPGSSPESTSPAMPAVLPVSPPPAAPAEAQVAEVQPANGQAAKRQFAADAKADDDLESALRAPESRWEVKAGAVIPAALLTAINSDLPGEIVAQVTEPVYDHATGSTVLIPQGSRLIGKYDSQVAYGQDRVLIAWNRIIMPDGRSINIGSMEGADLGGASGLRDHVNGHFWQLARGVLLSTVFSIGAASAQDASARSSGGLVLNSAGTGVANEAEVVGSQITSRDLNRQPTITVRAGWPLRVLVNKDMILAPYP